LHAKPPLCGDAHPSDAKGKVALDDITLIGRAWKIIKALHLECGDIPKICRVTPPPLGHWPLNFWQGC